MCSSRLGKDVTHTGVCTNKESEIDLTHDKQTELPAQGSLRRGMFLVAGVSKARSNSHDTCNATFTEEEGQKIMIARDLVVGG